MFVLRYVALAALAIWVGGMIVLLLAGTQPAELLRTVQRLALACGSLVFVALFAMKFLGPPPHAFPLRAVIVAAMIAIALVAGAAGARRFATALTTVNAVVGLFLLSFYARE